MPSTSKQLQQMEIKNNNPFRAAYPIDFDLFDKDSQNVLYIEDSSDQLLTLEIRNAAAQDIVLSDLGAAPLSSTNYHFALRFRPGTLAAASLSGEKSIQLTGHSAKNNWEMLLSAQKDSESWDVIYLRKTNDLTLKPSRSLEKDLRQAVVFKHVGADAGQGARGTRVELLCTNMRYQGSAEPIRTQREMHLSIINHRGKKDIPLSLGFVGGNAVVNDGRTNNSLTLRIANIAPYDVLNPTQSTLTFKYDTDETKATQFFFSFHTGTANDPWALDTETRVNDITIEASKSWIIKTPGQTKEGYWQLLPTETMVLQSMTAPDNDGHCHIDIAIKNIISGFPCGQTHLYVHYRNIPGYWDGSLACIIEKTPIRVEQNLVEVHGSSSGVGDDVPFRIIAREGIGPVMGYLVQDEEGRKTELLRIGAYGGNNSIKNYNRPLVVENGKTEIARFTTEDVDIKTTLTCKENLQIKGSGDNVLDILANDGARIMRIGAFSKANNIENYDRPLVIRHKDKDKQDVEVAWFTKSDVSILTTLDSNAPVTPGASLNVGCSKDHPSALQLISGNAGYNVAQKDKVALNQVVLSYYYDDQYKHAIKTRHNGNEGKGNAIDFYVWDKGKDQSTSVGTLHTLSLNNGKVGIGGITDPDYSLEVNGDIKCHGKLFIQVVNQLKGHEVRYMAHKPSSHEVGWYDSSDERLKKNIAPVTDALDVIQQLRGVSFQWNEEGLRQKTRDVEESYRSASNTADDNARLWDAEKQRIRRENGRTFRGFIAQEVEAVCPDWVKEDENGYKAINMDELTPVLVEALKAQQQQINTLQAQLALLMKEVEALKMK